MRSGTLNVPGIVGFGKACELCRIEMEKDASQIERLRDKLETELLKLDDVYRKWKCMNTGCLTCAI